MLLLLLQGLATFVRGATGLVLDLLEFLDLEKFDFSWRHLLLAFSAFLLFLHPNFKVELREVTESTFDFDFASLDLGQELGRRQAESYALSDCLSAIAVHVADLKGLEQVLNIVLLDTVATIFDGALQVGLVLALVAHLDLHQDGALVSVELYRVNERMEHGLLDHLPIGQVLIVRLWILNAIQVLLDRINDCVGYLLAFDHRDEWLNCFLEGCFNLIPVESRPLNDDVALVHESLPIDHRADRKLENFARAPYKLGIVFSAAKQLHCVTFLGCFLVFDKALELVFKTGRHVDDAVERSK